MSDQVLLNSLNKLRKRDKCEACRAFYLFFYCSEFDKFNNTQARIIDSIYYGVKTSRFPLFYAAL